MSPGEGWIQAAKSRPVSEVAADLGLETRHRRFMCPACNNPLKDGRGSLVLLRSGGWFCSHENSCNQRGDVVDLVALKLTGKPCRELDREGWQAVRAWWGQGPALSPSQPTAALAPPPDHPPVEKVAAFWSGLPRLPAEGVTGAIHPPETAPEPAMAAFWDEWRASGRPMPGSTAESGMAALVVWLRSRAIDPQRAALLDLCRPAPRAHPPRLAEGERAVRGYGWPYGAVVPMVDSTGLIRSFRFRAVVSGEEVKSRALQGYSCAGLVFADPMARALLSRAGDEPEAVDLGAGVVASWNGRIAICEGEPDYLTAAADIDRTDEDEGQLWTYAVIGTAGTSGGLPAEIAARFPKDSRVVIYQHSDEKGRAFAAGVVATLRTAGVSDVEVMNLPAKDLNDVATGKPAKVAAGSLSGQVDSGPSLTPEAT